MRSDSSLRTAPAIVAGVAAGGFLLVTADRGIVRLGILAVMLLFFVTLTVPALKRVLLAISLLEIPIQVDIYLNYDEVESATNALSGFNLSITTVVLVALYALWGTELAGGFSRLSPAALRAALPSFVYLALVTLSLAVAADTLLALYEIVLLAQVLLLFFYLLNHVRSRDDLMFVVTILLVGLVAQSLISMGLKVLGEDLQIGPVLADIDGGRVNGTFGSPNALGGYLSLLMPLGLSLMVANVGSFHRRLGGIGLTLGSMTLVLTFSRGAWIGFAISTGLVVVVAWQRRWLRGAMAAAMAAAVLVFLIAFQDEILLRLGEYNNAAAQSRLPLMELASAMIRDRPLLGVGANNFAAQLDPYVTVEYSKSWISTVHNKYLLVWAETGILALMAFLVVLAAAVRSGWRAMTGSDRVTSPVALGLMAGVIANMIHMTVDLFHGRAQVQMLWVVVALLLALPQISQSVPVSREEDADRLITPRT